MQVYKLNLMVDALLLASFLFVIVHYGGRTSYGEETAAAAAVGSIVLLLLLMAQLVKASNSPSNLLYVAVTSTTFRSEHLKPALMWQ